MSKAMSQKGSEMNRTGSNHRSKVKALLVDYGFSIEENYKPEGYTDFAGCQIIIPIYAWNEAFPQGIALCPFLSKRVRNSVHETTRFMDENFVSLSLPCDRSC